MQQNFILCLCFGCLAYILLLNGADGNPLIEPTSKQIMGHNASNYGQNNITAKDSPLVAESSQYIEMFGKRKNSGAGEKDVRGGAAGGAESDAADDGGAVGVPEKGVGESAGGGAEDRAQKADGGGGGDNVKELTISLPRFKTDAMGNWVYNPWGVTFGKVWEDTRFNVNGHITIPRIHLDRSPATDYYPYNKVLNTVCLGKSTIYNQIKVMGYLNTVYEDNFRKNRPILRELRRNLFKNGNSEECHVSTMTRHRNFQECMIRRNQRMEYLIPNYPRHQRL